MLYEANRSSTVLMRGIFAGSTDASCARTWSGIEEGTSTTAMKAYQSWTATDLHAIRNLCAKGHDRRAMLEMILEKPVLASILRLAHRSPANISTSISASVKRE